MFFLSFAGLFTKFRWRSINDALMIIFHACSAQLRFQTITKLYVRLLAHRLTRLTRDSRSTESLESHFGHYKFNNGISTLDWNCVQIKESYTSVCLSCSVGCLSISILLSFFLSTTTNEIHIKRTENTGSL